MNKGLEVIEAHELFGIGYDHIEVVVHPQSIVHSMVEFTDGATIAQLSLPDMRLPHRLRPGLPRPARHARSGASTGPTLGRLDFEPPDLEAFPCLGLAYEAGRAGGTPRRGSTPPTRSPSQAFLDGRIAVARHRLTSSTAALDRHDGDRRRRRPTPCIDADRRARDVAADDHRDGPQPRDRHPVDPTPRRRRRRRPAERRAPSDAGRASASSLLVGARRPLGVARRLAAARGDRRHRRDDLPARARPLPHGQVGGHEGHRVLHRLRPPHLVVPPGRDRVRPQGHPGRGLREDHRDEQPRGGRPGRRAPHLPPEAVLAPHVGGRGRLDHALPHRLRAALRRCSPSSACPAAGRRRPASVGDDRARARRSARRRRQRRRRGRPARPATASLAVDGQRGRRRSTTLDASYVRGAARASAVDARRRARRRAASTLDGRRSAAERPATASERRLPRRRRRRRHPTSARRRSTRSAEAFDDVRRAVTRSRSTALGRILSPSVSSDLGDQVADARRRRRPDVGDADAGDRRRRRATVDATTASGVDRRRRPASAADRRRRRRRRLLRALRRCSTSSSASSTWCRCCPLDGGHVAIATYEQIRSMRRGGAYHADVAKLLPLTYAVVLVLVVRSVVSTLYLDIVDPLERLADVLVDGGFPRRTTRQVILAHPTNPVAVGGGAPITVQSMTITKTADVEGTLAADLRAGRRRRRHRALHVQRDRGGRGPGPDRAPLAGADRRRHPPPVQDGARRARGRRALPAAQPRQHPQARAHQGRGAASASDRGVPIRIGVNGGSLDPDALREARRRVTPEAMVESAQRELAYFDEVGFDDVKISVKASNVPLMIEAYRHARRGHRPPAAPRRHRGRARRRPG